jgi:hypothetical protein
MPGDEKPHVQSIADDISNFVERLSNANYTSRETERAVDKVLRQSDLPHKRAHTLHIMEIVLKCLVAVGLAGVVISGIGASIYSAPDSASQTERVKHLFEQLPGLVGATLGGLAIGARYIRPKD